MTLPAPDSLPDFQSMFPDEEHCADYLFALRWPRGFRCATCRVKAIVHTDGWGGYGGLREMGYRHKAVVQGDATNAAWALPMIHREFGNPKVWLKGTHHGRVERQHLQAYLNEFVFRHNRRFWPFSAFQRVLSLGLEAPVQTYRQLYDADEYGRDVHLAGMEG